MPFRRSRPVWPAWRRAQKAVGKRRRVVVVGQERRVLLRRKHPADDAVDDRIKDKVLNGRHSWEQGRVPK
jgi:hypothetical protein